jgi:hypothetical protein
MKRPDTGKTFLDQEDINMILPKELKLENERHSRGVYRAANGCLISISNSKEYAKGYLSWYYVYADRYAEIGVKYMIFTVGLSGIVLVPMDIFQSYKVGCSWKNGLRKGEKRYRIDIAKKDGTFVFINSSQRHQKILDLTPYFIPFSK